MNKYYPTKELVGGWLIEANTARTLGGIKNIIGIIVRYNDKELFYSIFDDCFFRLLPSKEELIYNNEIYSNQLFVEVYTAIPDFGYLTIGDNLYKKTNTDFLTKDDIIKYKSFISGHYADLDYVDKLGTDTKVDYENPSEFDNFIIRTEPEYRAKQGRFITFEEDCISGPIKKKKL